MQFVHSELDGAINDIGKGKSFDGLSGKVLQLTPPKLRECILKLLVTIFNNTYPSQWRTQLLLPLEKKGHKDNNPKLRGIAIGPLLSRLYDIIINKRFCSWYVPNPEQAGFREHHGCIVQIFALFLTMEMAKSLRKSLFIGLLDFEKAFDFMNRPTLMKDLMEQEIGCIFLRSLNKMYEEINYSPKISRNMMGEPISANHGVTQGRNSSCNIFSFYISDMSNSLKNLDIIDFTDPENCLQFADDTVIMAEYEDCLLLKFRKLFDYTKRKYIIVNMDKTKYLHLTENPTLNDIKLDNESIEAVNPRDGYNWLGFHLSYSSEVNKLVEFNFLKKKANIGKFYAWLQVNNNTPFPLKMKILYNCMFPSLLYSCEAWGNLKKMENELLLIERKALRACLGVKQGTPDDILYFEINKPDIIAAIYLRQYKFYQKFIQLQSNNSTAKSILEKYMGLDNGIGKPFLEHYESLQHQHFSNNIEIRKQNINTSNKSMYIRYRELFKLEYNDILYKSMVDDSHRTVITRWRLSSHILFIETGRYKRPVIDRNERKCIICSVLEDEKHALFICRAHNSIRNNYRKLLYEYPTTERMLNPIKEEDIIRIAKYIREIEMNMKNLQMMR